MPDPVGEVIASWRRPNGLEISQVRVPIGVIAIIYESRPNVTVDAGVLASRPATRWCCAAAKRRSRPTPFLAALIGASAGSRRDRSRCRELRRTIPIARSIQILKRHPEAIDLIIPRGGKALKEALAGSAVPLLPHFDGICHTYVDRAADLKMAEEICFNAKCSRPSVCNAMETMLVHREVAPRFCRRWPRGWARGRRIARLTTRTRAISRARTPATRRRLGHRVSRPDTGDKGGRLARRGDRIIARHGSGLADAIVTGDEEAAATRFEREVDSATVYVNASTRFTDGFEFGFGAETGISTNRLHARGPMGLRELTTYKYLVRGNGQVRELKLDGPPSCA